jgi:tRNA pseudouridine38-40 synthase
MARYFIKVGYKGTNYAGFQIQKNANSIQAEVEKALEVFFRSKITLTSSSRTDAGVHAFSNCFHFDSEALPGPEILGKAKYSLNSILPRDIVVKRIWQVEENAHSRFNAIYREYEYWIYQDKDPFLEDRAYYYPYSLDLMKLQQAAALIKTHTNFTSFSKRNTQVKTFDCTILESSWIKKENALVYRVRANRFLRGMVRGLVGTMLKVGTGKTTIQDLQRIIESKDCSKADFSVPPQGLFLVEVNYPLGIEVPKALADS